VLADIISFSVTSFSEGNGSSAKYAIIFDESKDELPSAATGRGSVGGSKDCGCLGHSRQREL